MYRLVAVLLLSIVAGCAGSEGADEADVPITLGPVDGDGLSATDTARVQAGDLAPDFTLASLSGEPITLSSYRGAQNVVLVFYRGHW